MPPRTEDSLPADFDHRVLSAELTGIVERIHSVITDPMWSVTVHRTQLKIAIDSMAVFTLMHSKDNPEVNHLYRYWPTQRWSVVVIQADQPQLYVHVSRMMELISSWGVVTHFELFGMAKQSAMLVEDLPYQSKHLASGSGTLQTAKGEVAYSFPETLTITRLDNKSANERRDA